MDELIEAAEKVRTDADKARSDKQKADAKTRTDEITAAAKGIDDSVKADHETANAALKKSVLS